MGGQICLKENEIALMNVLLKIQANANPQKIQKQKSIGITSTPNRNLILQELLVGVSPSLKSKTVPTVTEEKLLGQLNVVVLWYSLTMLVLFCCQTFPPLKKQTARLPHQYK